MPHHPAVESLLNYFAYEHLPPHLADTSRQFHDLAHTFADHVRDDGGPETAVALRKLLEAKDAAVRSVLTADRDIALAEQADQRPDLEVTAGGFGTALLARLELDPMEVRVSGFQVAFEGNTAVVSYHGVKRLPSADVLQLMGEHGMAPGAGS